MIKSLMNMSIFAIDQRPNSTSLTCLKSAFLDVHERLSSTENTDFTNNNMNEINEILKCESGVDILALRKCFLKKAIPDFTQDSVLRSKIWKVLLGVPCSFDSEYYLDKIENCPSKFKDKISDDAFRTFKGNEVFWSKVEVSRLTRVLCAIATDHGYVQGMNVLLGPLAFIMSELDCYYCMKTLIASHIPGYVLKNLDGVHRGVRVFDQCLQLLDGRLYAHIISKIPDLTIFSLRYVMTLMANAQPLEAVLRLWDVLFAFGIHLNVVMLSVHLMSIRDKILKLNSGFKILKLIEDTPLDCEGLIQGSLSMIQFLPIPLFEEMIAHPLLLPGEG